jgi:hypothetical protein
VNTTSYHMFESSRLAGSDPRRARMRSQGRAYADIMVPCFTIYDCQYHSTLLTKEMDGWILALHCSESAMIHAVRGSASRPRRGLWRV